MACLVTESWDSQRINSNPRAPTGEVVYDVVLDVLAGAATDRDTVIAAAIAQYNADYPTLRGLAPLTYDAMCMGGPVWKVSVGYGVPDFMTATVPGGVAPGAAVVDPSFTATISGQTQHVTQSLSTITKLFNAPDTGAIDFQQAIGVGPKGDIAGCDIYSPQAEMTLTRYYPAISLAFYGSLVKAVGATNQGAWGAFAQDEVLFVGATITPRAVNAQDGLGAFAIAYRFITAPTLTGVVISPTFTLASKPGHAYIWVYYAPSKDTVTQRMKQIPRFVYVEQVYRRIDYLSTFGF